MRLVDAKDVKSILRGILKKISFPQIKINQIFCLRSFGAKSRARARIWSFPHIWQLVLKEKPYYIIEVLSQHFDHLSEDDKTRVLIHELMHIPKNFSGALVPHRGIHKQINQHTVEVLFKQFKQDRP